MSNIEDNLFDYLKWRSDLSFSRCKINELDFALFSQIIMIPYTLYIDMPMSRTQDYITIKDLALLVKHNKEKFVKQMGLIVPPQIVDILIKMGESHRFENIIVRNYSLRRMTMNRILLDAKKLLLGIDESENTPADFKEEINNSRRN